MSCLKETTAELATGDPILCTGCQAMFNFFSLLTVEEEKQVWVCEFCNHKNSVHIDAEEKPKSDTVSYIIEAAPVQTKAGTEETKKDECSLAKDISIVYCIDVSGSMAGSRLTAVQKTIRGQVNEMAEKHPERKIGIVTFTDNVRIIGDGTREPLQINGGDLNNYDNILKNAVASSAGLLQQPLSSTRKAMDKAVDDLRATGSTALGPGMLAAIGLAGEGSPGSQVIVCTDGAANMGLGVGDSSFYSRIGEYAQTKGVTVHIVTFIGTECNIEAISIVSQMTNGEIERVDVNNIGQNFKEFLAKPVLATKVQLKVKVHKGLEFRNELVQNLNEDRTILSKDFGNVNEDTDVCFEYQMKPLRELLKIKEIDFSALTKLPFQAQIHYTALDGSRQVRVFTQFLEISTDKEDLKKNADFQILGINAIQQSSKLARQGEFKQAQAVAKAWDKVMNRDAKTLSTTQQAEVHNYRANIGETYSLMH